MLTDFGRKSYVTWTTGLKERIEKAEKENQMKPYRAIPIDGKDFVYGWYIKLGSHHLIADENTDWDNAGDVGVIEIEGLIEVIPETVGQQVGQQDKNKKEIHAGDTLRNPKDPRGNGLFDVAWSEMFHGWIGNSQTECLQMKACMFDESEIIGNIHQNPELMEQDNA